jgi:phospholipase/lecithinase/hemolysin
MSPKVLALAAALLSAPLNVAFASSFSELVVFGDSPSDAGNASIYEMGQLPGRSSNYATRTGLGLPFPIYYLTDGTNTTPSSGSGPTGLWIDQLAGKLGVPDPKPALAPPFTGTNYAVAGSTTGSGTGNMGDQTSTFLTLHPFGTAPSTALYTFWGGANDLLQNQTPANAKQAADNIEKEIQQVAMDGGKTFLWLNLPPLGDTPYAISGGASAIAGANLLTNIFNTEYSADVAALRAQGIDVISLDVYSLFSQLVNDPSAYGFTDVTDGCINTSTYTSPHPCMATSNPNQYLFWDDIHPTTQGYMFLADAADAQVAPEPATYALLLLGGCGLLAMRRRVRTGR